MSESKCTRKETVGKDTFNNDNRKTTQLIIKATSTTSHKNKEMEPILPIQMKTLQNSTYKKDFD